MREYYHFFYYLLFIFFFNPYIRIHIPKEKKLKKEKKGVKYRRDLIFPATIASRSWLGFVVALSRFVLSPQPEYIHLVSQEAGSSLSLSLLSVCVPG